MSKPSERSSIFLDFIWVGSAINRLKHQAVNLKDGGSSPSRPANIMTYYFYDGIEYIRENNTVHMKKFLLIFIILFSLSILKGQETIQLRWEPSTDNVGVTGYNVWIDAEYYGTTSDTSFILSLDPGMYALAVSAFDAAGNESEQSMSLMVTIGDVTTPSIPYDLIIIYPNPTYGDFRVMLIDEIKEDAILQILTLTGQIILERAMPPSGPKCEEEFSLSLAPGTYVVALIENNKRKCHAHLTVYKKHKELIAKNNNLQYTTVGASLVVK